MQSIEEPKENSAEYLLNADESDEAYVTHVDQLGNFRSKRINSNLFLESGSWPFIKQRPLWYIAHPEDIPKCYFCFNHRHAPLDVDL